MYIIWDPLGNRTDLNTDGLKQLHSTSNCPCSYLSLLPFLCRLPLLCPHSCLYLPCPCLLPCPYLFPFLSPECRDANRCKQMQTDAKSIKEHQRAMFQLLRNEASSPCFAPLASMISARSFPLPLPFGAAGGPCHCF